MAKADNDLSDANPFGQIHPMNPPARPQSAAAFGYVVGALAGAFVTLCVVFGIALMGAA